MLGSTSISKLYLGSTEVSKAYLGSTEVYSSQEFLLDTYGSAEFAYSLRELTANRSAFTSTGDTGSQTSGVWTVQIRRSSDNNQKSFTSEEITDGTLTTWVGSGNIGYVSRWYDQSGNSNDGYQSTTTRQPVLVESTGLVYEGSNTAIRPDGSDDYLFITTPHIGYSDIFTVYRATNNSSAVFRHLNVSASAGGRRSNGTWYYQDSTGTLAIGTTHPSTQVVSEFSHFSSTKSIYSNDQLIGDTATTAAPTSDIGRVGFYTGGGTGTLSEFILYSSDKSTDRSNIFSNMNAYYGAY